MNSFFPILNWVGLLLLKGELSHCTPYQEAERDSYAQWAAFKASHLEALSGEMLDLLDRCNLTTAQECDTAFYLGLRLDLELGGFDRFQDMESWGMTFQCDAATQAPPEA